MICSLLDGLSSRGSKLVSSVGKDRLSIRQGENARTRGLGPLQYLSPQSFALASHISRRNTRTDLLHVVYSLSLPASPLHADRIVPFCCNPFTSLRAENEELTERIGKVAGKASWKAMEPKQLPKLPTGHQHKAWKCGEEMLLSCMTEDHAGYS